MPPVLFSAADRRAFLVVSVETLPQLVRLSPVLPFLALEVVTVQVQLVQSSRATRQCKQ